MRKAAYMAFAALWLTPWGANAYLPPVEEVPYVQRSCAKEGESGGGTADARACCAGLTFVSQYQKSRFVNHHQCKQSLEEAELPPPGTGGTCTACGDGVCKEPEDSCNCPADCKK